MELPDDSLSISMELQSHAPGYVTPLNDVTSQATATARSRFNCCTFTAGRAQHMRLWQELHGLRPRQELRALRPRQELHKCQTATSPHFRLLTTAKRCHHHQRTVLEVCFLLCISAYIQWYIVYYKLWIRLCGECRWDCQRGIFLNSPVLSSGCVVLLCCYPAMRSGQIRR